ncbi:type II toxin-antitoxin system CcdA family antitoxin [Deinococcus sp. HMF7604]|uniref:type II toxin-antitoxin system CcdA family antitoxin n=1 Tax=Deinococcus betulae TaxID=2873312 RepID=UPI001CCA1EA4|nr:type II toxin-antitoxin system CcdA family antitoxin [Deinococcus betulae]MBZ9751319.1 type II toxin-antitoxin system CcdA family antitoxin [Deinococcus betulae]
MGKTTKARLNLTIDPDLYREARRVFTAMEMNMSAFVEIQLARFLQTTQPLMPLLDQAERGERDLAEAKAAMRIWFAHSIGQPLTEAYGVAGEEVLSPVRPLKTKAALQDEAANDG